MKRRFTAIQTRRLISWRRWYKMHKLLYEKQNGELIDLLAIQNATVTNVTGLGMAKSLLTYYKRADMDGEELNAVTFDKRTIQITYRLTGGRENSITRRYIYNLFSSKKPARLFYVDDELNVYTSVTVEDVDTVVWTNTPTMIVTFAAPDPFFRTVEKSNIARSVENKFIFPLEITPPYEFGEIKEETSLIINNGGQVESPLHLVLKTNSSVENPTVIINNGDFFGLNYTFEADTEIHIITKRGNKTVYFEKNGVKTDLFAFVSAASSWLQMEQGQNVFNVSAANANADLTLTILYEELYIGVE